MALLINEAYNYYDLIMLEELKDTLIGVDLVAKAPSLPAGTQQVTRDELEALQGKAKKGKKGQPIPRETGDITRKTVLIPEIAHGFELHRKDLEASQNKGEPLPDVAARQSTRLVAEAIEDMIFNGIPELNIKGIYADAGDTYAVEENYEWNTANGQPFNNMVEAFAQLEGNGSFTGRKLVLSPRAYRTAFKTNTMGVSYMTQIASLFPNGMGDIYKAPSTVQGETIIPEDGGVLFDFGNRIAERYVEEEVNLQADFEMDKNNLIPFNILTYQSLDIHEVNAFLALDNLIEPDTP